MDPADPSALLGEWTLRRTASDLRAGLVGLVSGTLQLTSHDGGIGWLETGSLCWGGQDRSFRRRYELRETPGGWWVHFEDGRPFHPWRVGEWVEHPCRADLYRGLVEAREDGWSVLWEVGGPHKSQRIVSDLSRG